MIYEIDVLFTLLKCMIRQSKILRARLEQVEAERDNLYARLKELERERER